MLKQLARVVSIDAVKSIQAQSARITFATAKFASSSDEDERPGNEETTQSRANFRNWVDDMLESDKQPSGADTMDSQPQSNLDLGPVDGGGQRQASATVLEEAASETAPETDAAMPKSQSTSASGEAPRRYTVLEETVQALPDVVLGYRELGITDPSDGALLNEGDGNINSARKFFPAQTYEPHDLVSSSVRYQKKHPIKGTKKAGNAETMREADFRNLSFLNRFTSDAGMIPPRRVTKLQKKVHTHLCKQIKIARQMALLPPEGKLAELQPERRFN